MITQAQFVDLVARMRQAQRDYFRERLTTQLHAARGWERLVDRAIVELRKQPEQGAEQVGLFGEA